MFCGKNIAAFTLAAEMGWAQVKYSMQTGETFLTVVLEDIVAKEEKKYYTILAQRGLCLCLL